jgi:hypothetical protein
MITRREGLASDDARLAWIAWMDATGRKSVLASFHRYEVRLERSARQARRELDRRRVTTNDKITTKSRQLLDSITRSVPSTNIQHPTSHFLTSWKSA